MALRYGNLVSILYETTNPQVALRQAGYSESAISEMGAALALLVKHGVLGLALPAALPAPPLSAAYFPLAAQEPPAVFGPIGQLPLGMYSGRTALPYSTPTLLLLYPIRKQGLVSGVACSFEQNQLSVPAQIKLDTR